MKTTELSTIPLTMSTLEIAGLTGKRHDHVMADARKMLAELDIQSPQFSGDYIDGRGRKQECFNLPKRECTILVSGYSIELRARIVDRWLKLEAAVAPTVGLSGNLAEGIERTFGIARMLSHKVTEQGEQLLALGRLCQEQARILAEQGRELSAQRRLTAALEDKFEVSPHHSAPNHLFVIDLLIEYGALPRNRRALSKRVGDRMAKRAHELGVEEIVIKSNKGKRMFERKFAYAYMREAGTALVIEHNLRAKSAEAGQTVLDFRRRGDK